MTRQILQLLFPALMSASLAFADAPKFREVPVQIEPPQLIKAIVIRSGESPRSVEIRNGKALVPSEFALPWTLGLTRFEPIVYSESDRAAAKPLIIRELGRMRGMLRGSRPKEEKKFIWLLQRAGVDSPQEVEFLVDDDGSFEVALAAGTYHAAAIGSKSGTKVRSGIIVKPGESTNVENLVCEPTVPISLRVLDAKRGTAVAGARVTWSPPDEKLNSRLHRALYARRWSAITDRYGLATITSVGPAPLSVRWNVQAKGYAPGHTAQLLISEPKRMAIPDVRLRPEATVLVRVQLPTSREKVFRGASLLLGEQEDATLLRFTRRAQTELREGETRFSLPSYGRKRIWVESSAGRKILYRDFEISSESTVIDLVPQEIEIRGRVMRKGLPVADVLVTLADPTDASVILGQTRADDNGEYRITTFQAGELFVYTIGKARSGRTGAARARFDTAGKTDVRVDLEMDTSGFTVRVVDSNNDAPVTADVDFRFMFSKDRASEGHGATDREGRFTVSDYPEGTAKLNIQAKGYRAQDVEIPIRADLPEMEVRLMPSRSARGRVLDSQGAPIAAARITGGYEHELDAQAAFFASTDASGRFEFESAPEPGTRFYIAAPGHALGMATLSTEHENVVRLTDPSPGTVTLRPNNAIPTKIYMVMAAPVGSDSFIPLGAFEDLAEVNGMTRYQLQGSALDGTVVLSEFLPPGTFTLYLALRGGEPFLYERIGTITTPADRNIVLAYKGK